MPEPATDAIHDILTEYQPIATVFEINCNSHVDDLSQTVEGTSSV